MVSELTVEQVGLPEFGELGRLFFEEAKFAHRFSAEHFRNSWETLLRSGAGHILGVFVEGTLVAVLGFVISPDLTDGKPVAYETFWFALPAYRGHGLALLRAYEACAKKHGAQRISMVHLETLNAGRLKSLYIRMGFTPAETHYFKEIS